MGCFTIAVEDLYLLDDFGGEVVGCYLRVTLEEALAVDHDLLDGLPVDGDVAVLIDAGSRELLDEVSDDRPLIRGEVASVEFDRVALDDDVAGLPDDLHPFKDFALSLEGDGGQRE